MGAIDITLREFRGFVFNELDGYYDECVSGGEIAFDLNVGTGYTLRILTSIPADDDVVREKGDAIRVILLSPNDELVQGTAHVKRMPNYRTHIKERIDELIGCENCDGDMRLSAGDYGPYMFCTNDDCEFTRSLDD